MESFKDPRVGVIYALSRQYKDIPLPQLEEMRKGILGRVPCPPLEMAIIQKTLELEAAKEAITMNIAIDLTDIHPDSTTARFVVAKMEDLWRTGCISAAVYQEAAEHLVSGTQLKSIINDIRTATMETK